jgi:capsular polysaccharide transport system permease protein
MHRVAESINGNKALLFYPHVRPLDLAFARIVLEFVTYIAVFAVLMSANALYRERLEISDVLGIVMGFGMASLFGASLGLVFCVLAQFSNTVDRVRGPLTRPFFWISGIFFTANALPAHVRHGMLYNPVLHATEMVRDGWFPGYTAHDVDPLYVMQWVLGLALVGLSLERVVRRKIEVT